LKTLSWLPDTLDTDGEWPDTLNNLYKIFCDDFKNTSLTYNGLPIGWQRDKIDDDKDEGFWHLITNDEITISGKKDRIPDYDRAKRLPWCKAIINNANEEEVIVFEYLEGKTKNNKPKIRTYLWLKDWDFVVILAKNMRPIQHYYLVTAFYLNHKSSKRNISKKYQNRIV